MSYPCEVVDQTAQPVLSIRTRTTVQALPQVLGQLYGAIGQYMGELRKAPAGPPFVAYYNVDMQDLDIEVGFPFAHALPGKGEIQAGEIAAGKYATCLYTGPYSGVHVAYAALSSWMQEHGYQPTGVAYEFYLNDPSEVPPEELQTRVQMPVSPA